MEKLRMSQQRPIGLEDKLEQLLKLIEGLNYDSVKELFKAAKAEIKTYSFIEFQRLK